MYVLNRGGPEAVGRLELKRVCVCTADEGYIGEWGTGGTEDGQFWWPSAIARDGDGRLYVADEALQRINVFESRRRVHPLLGRNRRRPGANQPPR